MTTDITRRVHVRRNRYGKPGQPWLVTCEYCAGDASFLAGLFGAGVKGWAADWATAQDFAVRHALAHEARRCPTCLHVPTGPLPEEATNARH